jgi:NADH:ubiquinone oxidoreductase subunit 6 (subunit J)
MPDIFVKYVVPVAVLAVAVVLLFGLWNMMRGGSPNLSQKLMRWRVGLQFLAICVIMVTVWLMNRH